MLCRPACLDGKHHYPACRAANTPLRGPAHPDGADATTGGLCALKIDGDLWRDHHTHSRRLSGREAAGDRVHAERQFRRLEVELPPLGLAGGEA
jgi:hypothetical protein